MQKQHVKQKQDLDSRLSGDFAKLLNKLGYWVKTPAFTANSRILSDHGTPDPIKGNVVQNRHRQAADWWDFGGIGSVLLG